LASEADIAALRRFYDEVARGNFWVGREVFDPEIEWQWSSRAEALTGSQVYRGLDEVEAATKDWLEAWDWFRIELEELRDARERIVALTRNIGRPRGSDTEITALAAEVWTMRDGKAIAHRSYDERQDALRDAGL
jgi:HAMP domain-containing protein